MGKLGRKAIASVLPSLKQELGVDVVIANGENVAHGKGMTRSTLAELFASGVNLVTSGNHMNKKPEGVEVLEEKILPVIRPYNWATVQESIPGRGYLIWEIKGKKIAIVNLIGQAFFKEMYENPFHAFDRIMQEIADQDISAVIVDFHGEATSEKVAFGWYVDGRVALVFGTHTHIPTADARMLLQGTGYITDLGLTGDRDGVIGVSREEAIEQYLTNMPSGFTLKEDGWAVFNAVLAEIDIDTGKCIHIQRVDRELEIR